MDKIQKALTTLELGFLSGRVDKNTIEKARGKVAGLGEISVHKDGSKYRKTAQGWVPIKGDVDHGRVETKEAHKERGFDENKGDEDITGTGEKLSNNSRRSIRELEDLSPNEMSFEEYLRLKGTKGSYSGSESEKNQCRVAYDKANKEKGDLIAEVSGDSIIAYKDENGDKFTFKKVTGGFDLFKNGVKIDVGAKTKGDIRQTIEHYKRTEKESSDFRKEGRHDSKSAEGVISPIRQLSTGANVYHESNNVRVNDSKYGVLLNVTDKDGGMSSASVVFPSVKEAVEVAKKIDKAYPQGVPSAVDAERMVDFFRKESAPIISNKEKGFFLEINKVGGNQYLHIKHDNTGLTIKNFNNHPIASGQVKLVKEAVNDILSKVDWDVKVNQIGDSHKKAVAELDRALELDSNGRYTLSKEYLSKIK